MKLPNEKKEMKGIYFKGLYLFIYIFIFLKKKKIIKLYFT
jgi:hypothetical protein